jgi:hypothetical protein
LESHHFGWHSFKGRNQLTKVGLIHLRRTSNCSWVNRTELYCSSSLSGSSWSSRVLGSSSLIDFGGTTRSSMGSSNMVFCACLRFFLGAIRNSQEVNQVQPELWYQVTRSQTPC